MAVTGMDVGEVKKLSTLLHNKANEIQGVLTQLNSQINNSQHIWVGNDANQFRNDWAHTHVNQLRAVINGLADASTKASRNAQAQEDTSNKLN